MLGMGGIPSLVQFVGFLFMPESPRWLICQGQEEKARRALQSMRGMLDIEEEYEQIKQTCREIQQEEEARGKLGCNNQWCRLQIIQDNTDNTSGG